MADIAFGKDLSVTETGIGGLKVVDLDGDLVDSRKRVEHQHILLGELHLRFGQNVEVF